MTPVDLIPTADLEVGDRIQALEPPSIYWYDAKVISKSDDGAEVTVTYRGFPASHNRSLRDGDEAVRESLDPASLKRERAAAPFGGRTVGLRADGTWTIERILSRSGPAAGASTRYTVRWHGWGPEWDSVATKIPSYLVDEFEDYQAEPDECAPRPKRVRRPFSTDLTDGTEHAVRECFVGSNATELMAALKKKAIKKMAFQRDPANEKEIFAAEPVSPWAFEGLQERLSRDAADAKPTCVVEHAVTPISAHRCGLSPADTFAVMDADLLAATLGDGAFKIHQETTGSACLAVPPHSEPNLGFCRNFFSRHAVRLDCRREHVRPLRSGFVATSRWRVCRGRYEESF